MSVPVLPSTLLAGNEPSDSAFSQLTTAINYALYPPAAKIIRTTTQSVNSSTATALSCDSSVLSTGTSTGMVNLGANPTRITIVDPGIYSIKGFAGWAANTTGVRAYNLRKNGVTVISSSVIPTVSGAGNAPSMTLQGWESLIAGDYLELIVSQDSGIALNIAAGAWLALTRESG